MHWLDTQLSGAIRVGLPWSSLIAFARIATNPRIFARPEIIAGAFSKYAARYTLLAAF